MVQQDTLNWGMTDHALIDVLSTAEQTELDRYEQTIDHGLNTFWEVGRALKAIREQRLYRAEYPTFEEYCRSRWSTSRRQANRLIAAAQVASNLGPIGPTSALTESQARELSQLDDPADQIVASDLAHILAGDRAPTAKDYRAAVEDVIALRTPPDLVAAGVDMRRHGALFTAAGDRGLMRGWLSGDAAPFEAIVSQARAEIDRRELAARPRDHTLIVGQRNDPHKPDPKIPPEPEPDDPQIVYEERMSGSAPRFNDGLKSSDSVEWYTPEAIYTRVRAVFGGTIDTDPCTSAAAQARIGALRYYTIEDDGLAQPWEGNAFVNPPYGDEIKPWPPRAVNAYESGECRSVILLVPGRTDTDWFTPLLVYPICIVHGRLTFWNPDRPDKPAPFPSIVVYLGPDVEAFRAAFADMGPIYVPLSQTKGAAL